MGIPVKDYPQYEVFADGTIYSHKSKKFLKPILHSNGYMFVEIFNNNGSKVKSIHRLVAEVYLPNPNNYPCVNHKDENPTNNNADNLEWCTHEYNSNYGTCIERRTKSMQKYWASEKHKQDKRKLGQRAKEMLSKGVVQKTKEGVIVNKFVSVNEAYRQTKIRHISDVCNGTRKTAGGYAWTFEGGEGISVSQ